MAVSYFVTDLHGSQDRYAKLFGSIEAGRPAGVFLGGDLLPSGMLSATSRGAPHDFVDEILTAGFTRLRRGMGDAYPEVFIILGNDDGRRPETALLHQDALGLWHYVHGRSVPFGKHVVYGYAYVPPTPFLLKDWERYDVSRYVDPGCVSPEDGYRTVSLPEHILRYSTIAKDLDHLAGNKDLSDSIFLFHTPPYDSPLDRAALDGKTVDHAPLDVHVGSIAVRRFLEAHQPLISLHGHVHESARITGEWRMKIGRTHAFSAAHDGRELALVRFDPGEPEAATRTLI